MVLFLFHSLCGLAGEGREPGKELTAAVDVEADAGLGQPIHVVASRAGLDLHRGVPQTAVPFEAGTGLALHDAITFQRVAAIEPDRCVGPAVIFWYAEGGHGISGHTREAIPLPIHMVVAKGLAFRLVEPVVSVPPGLIQADVSGTRI